jgi:hypothetical protein
MNMEQRAAQVRDSHPYPSADPVQRLRHAVSLFAGQHPENVAISATSNIYPTRDCLPGGSGYETGLTHGDLRALLARLGG